MTTPDALAQVLALVTAEQNDPHGVIESFALITPQGEQGTSETGSRIPSAQTPTVLASDVPAKSICGHGCNPPK